MAGGSSAYSVLGVEPDADLSAIEQAYRRLMKQHHPDREGGNRDRAAQINGAYRELKAIKGYRDPLELHRHPERDEGRGSGWAVAASIVALVIAALLVLYGPVSSVAQPSRTPFRQVPASAPAKDVMDKPLHLAAIDQSVQRARKLFRTSDELRLAKESSNCHMSLRSRPGLAQLDRCAAFDDAVILMQDRDPLRDRGPFNQLAVTTRLWSAASALSNDYLAIDSRFHRIRLRVELALAPSQPDAPALSDPLPLRRRPH